MRELEIADIIIQEGCYVNVWEEEDWVSLPTGIEVPAYLSCRKLIAKPVSRIIISTALNDKFDEFFNEATLIVGLATAGIPWATKLADQQNLPLAYVRSNSKDYGVGKLVEGNPDDNETAIIIDDTLFSGESVLRAIEALKTEKEIKTIGVLAIANLFSGGDSCFSNVIGVNTRSLTSYSQLCEVAVRKNILSEVQANLMMNFYEDPSSSPHKFRGTYGS